MTPDRLNAMGQLGSVSFQKFTPCWSAKKQLLHFYRSSCGAGYGFEFSAAAVQHPSLALSLGPRQNSAIRNGIDGSQGLASKPHGAHRFQFL